MAKKKKHISTGTPALVLLEKTNTAHTMHPYEHDPNSDLSYGLEAAQAIGADPNQVFKTLMTQVDGALVVAIVPVNRKLDLKALAAAVGGKKAVMADQDVAQRATGYVVGGISPLGQKTAHTTVLDSCALDYDNVYVSGGRRGLDVGLSPDALISLTQAKTAVIARD